MFLRYAAVCALLVLTPEVSPAQSSKYGDNWLMQNYRFGGPPAPSELRPTDPVVSELQEIQNTILAILRKANFAGDFEAAIAATAQATANAQLRGTINQRLQSPQEHKTLAEPAPSKPRVYLIAFTWATLGTIAAEFSRIDGSHVVRIEFRIRQVIHLRI